MKVKTPTKEQTAILEYNGCTVVTARPGSGKTYTIVEKIATIVPSLPKHQGIIAISYTNKASFELKERCIKKGCPLQESFFGTIDKFYISQIIIPFAPHLTNNLPKYEVVSTLSPGSKYSALENVTWPLSTPQISLLNEALSEGIILLKIIAETALYILQQVPETMRYLKARYTHIFIDEYQDCGKLQHLIFITLIENNLTGIAVGDFHQAIFGFSNRFPEFLLQLLSRKEFKHFTLNENHRCHPSISEYSLCLFNASKTIPDEKRVFHITVQGNEQNLAHAIDVQLAPIKKKYGVADNNQVAILCRSSATAQKISESLETPNKFFLETALDRENSDWGRLFRDILLSRCNNNIFAVDFSSQFFSEEYEAVKYRTALKLSHKIFSTDIYELSECEHEMIAFAKLVYPDKHNQDTLQLLHQILTTPELINNFIPSLKDEISIMTLHKSKGLEFNIVFHMDMYKWIFPNEYTSTTDQEQMLNLHYVGVTRAKDVCYIMNGTKRYRSQQNDYINASPSCFLHKDGLQARRRDCVWKIP